MASRKKVPAAKARKKATTKPVPRKGSAGKKAAGKKAAGKKAVGKKAAGKKPVGKKAVGRKPATKKAAPKSGPRKKEAGRSAVPKALAHVKAPLASGVTTAPPDVRESDIPTDEVEVPRLRDIRVVPKAPLDREKTPVSDPTEALMQQSAAPSQPPASSTSHAALVAARSPETDPANRRQFERVPYGAWVSIEREGRQEFCLARDVSIGGMFLKSSQPPPLGEPIRCLVVIEGDTEPLLLQGMVVRRSESEQGFGVRFLHLDSHQTGRLRDLLERPLKGARAPRGNAPG